MIVLKFSIRNTILPRRVIAYSVYVRFYSINALLLLLSISGRPSIQEASLNSPTLYKKINVCGLAFVIFRLFLSTNLISFPTRAHSSTPDSRDMNPSPRCSQGCKMEEHAFRTLHRKNRRQSLIFRACQEATW